MSRVCIVFDRLRTEEKMLQKEAAGLGYECIMCDAKTAQIDTEKKAGDDFGDVALERCVSYFRGLHFTMCLEFLDVPVINEFAVASVCGDKMFMTARLKKSGIPTPKTYFTFSGQAAAENAKKVGYPLVIKPVIGSWGRGVMPIRDDDAMDGILEIRGVTDGPHDRIYYLQEMIKRPPRDIRVITVGDQPVAAMYRKSAGFKTNLALDGQPELCKITGEMGELAARASQAVGGGILGVDMMEDESRGLLVHEVNNTVEFKGIAKVAEQNIPKKMIEFAMNLARK
ncbi:MAG: lysine biosynthesis protein LysX [Nitrosopumilus sp. D6]|nr:MAG: lysine biosynthesis protein LysX [Nitrosopumilus sp. D6]